MVGVREMASGYYHSLAVNYDGTFQTWGRYIDGERGDGGVTASNLPFIIPSLTNAIGVAAGENYSIALVADGIVWAWGLNSFGELGDGTTT